MTSVVIAYRQDPFIWSTLDALVSNAAFNKFEIIIVDDCSDTPLWVDTMEYPNIRIIRNSVNRGVGYCFDRGVEVALCDNIVLMGSDVMVKEGWLDSVEHYLSERIKHIGCSVCLTLDPSNTDVNNPVNDTKRRGATIIPLAFTEDLSADSPLLSDQYYVGTFDCRWIKTPPTEEIQVVPCMYGAFYMVRKSWYQYLRGWDTDPNRAMSGHSIWGGLEPWLALKCWLMGGQCEVVNTLETGHIFEKGSGSGRLDMFWYNKMFIAYTILPFIEAERLLNRVYQLRLENELPTLPFNMGRKLIHDNWMYVRHIRKINTPMFVRTFDSFCDEFNIEKTY